MTDRIFRYCLNRLLVFYGKRLDFPVQRVVDVDRSHYAIDNPTHSRLQEVFYILGKLLFDFLQRQADCQRVSEFNLQLEKSSFPLEKPTPQQSAQVPKVCGNCQHYRPFRDPETKRIHSSRMASCGWRMPEIIWPMAIRMAAGESDWKRLPVNPGTPRAVRIWKETNAETCECFVP